MDLNRQMVADGWAVAFRRYSKIYLAEETRARAAKAGLWSSQFVLPEEYRAAGRRQGLQQEGAHRAPTLSRSPGVACAIKGNRNRRGEWIYHLPGTPYYDQTRAEEMFCTEAEAVAAGYRASRVR